MKPVGLCAAGQGEERDLKQGGGEGSGSFCRGRNAAFKLKQ